MPDVKQFSSQGSSKPSRKQAAEVFAYDQTEEHLAVLSSACLGTCAAGFCYPGSIAAVVLLAAGISSGASISDVTNGIGFFFMFAGLAGTVGFVLSSISGLISAVAAYAMNRSMGYPLSARSAGICVGSLAGYVPTCWFLFGTREFGSISYVATVGLAGPITAMVFGSIGASWAISCQSIGYKFAAADQRPYQFSILHMMVGTAWIAAIFAIANALGTQEFAIATCGWFLLHALMIGIARTLKKLRNPSLISRVPLA